jgi:DNA-binding NarL/FixJ family response regulator
MDVNMCSILLVEDHRIMAQSLVTALSQRGPFHMAGVVESAEEAMELLPGLRVDLALVDVVLPQISGIEHVMKGKLYLSQPLLAGKPDLPL